MNPDKFHPVHTECVFDTDCMCLSTRGRSDPTCSHYRKALAHVEVPKTVPQAVSVQDKGLRPYSVGSRSRFPRTET